MSNVIFTRDKAETADLKCFLKNELILRITVTEKKFAPGAAAALFLSPSLRLSIPKG